MNVIVEPNGFLTSGDLSVSCVLGRGGVSDTKQEGDGTTPVGTFPLREVFYRPDRLARPDTLLPVRPLAPNDGWCDAPNDPAYNRRVKLPYPASAEKMWRDDRLYDLLVVVGFNDSPPKPGLGSAIFVHLVHPDRQPTEGCVAMTPTELLALVRQLGPASTITIRPASTTA